MKDPLSRALAILAMALAVSTAIFFFRETRRYGSPTSEQEFALYQQVREIIHDHYVEDVPSEQLIRDAMKGMVQGLDPYSQYYDRKEKERLQEENAGRFVGIGVIIENTLPPLTVLFPYPGSPAERAGLQVGDRIISIQGEPIEHLSIEKAREKIRGEEGSKVQMTVLPHDGGMPKQIEFTREFIRDPSVSKMAMLDEARGIGYLHISSFSQETVSEFDQAMEKLQKEGMKSLIVDLRFNPGGVLDAAIGLSNRFLKEGVIVSTKGRNPAFSREHRAQPEECRYAGLPVAILINADTASASEIFAGAMQDHQLATVLGSTSYGKGVVQSLKLVQDGNAMVKLTTSHYYTPHNRMIERSESQRGGIEPDIKITTPKALEDALRRSSYRYDVPESYRDAVEKLRKEKGLRADERLQDPLLDAGLAFLLGKKPAEAPR